MKKPPHQPGVVPPGSCYVIPPVPFPMAYSLQNAKVLPIRNVRRTVQSSSASSDRKIITGLLVLLFITVLSLLIFTGILTKLFVYLHNDIETTKDPNDQFNGNRYRPPDIIPSVLSHPDQVHHLPGVKFSVNFRHFSGYLYTGDGSFFHYWFFESQNQPGSDPVVLWLNGGPGCSSMIGALTENGPFMLANDGRTEILPNPFSWNSRANVLYLESPAGVGFSYRRDKNYTTSDNKTAYDNLAAIRHFFRKFPHFLENEFYVTGESYGGIYVPMLVDLMVKEKFPKNIRGLSIGNGLLDYGFDYLSLPYFFYYHGLIGVESWSRYIDQCCPNVSSSEICIPNESDHLCSNALKDLISRGDAKPAQLNPYNIYANCRSISHLSPCLDGRDLEWYLNRKSVRYALNVKLGIKFHQCNDQINESYIREMKSIDVIIKKLLDTGLKVLIYNGDIDGVCNFLGAQWFVESLGLPETSPFGPWTYGNQIGGFSKRFGNLTFATVRGAGHMVPTDRPGPAQQLFHQFIDQN